MSDTEPGRTDPAPPTRRILEGVLGVPATDGNEIVALRNGDEIFPAMLEAIDAARHTVDFLTFVYWTGDIARRFADALAAKARDGVRVRVLLDAVGARHLDDDLVTEMTDAGCDLRWFRSVDGEDVGTATNRTHRKVLICDEEVSFTGGVGIAEEWEGDARHEGEWRDTHFCVRGPATDGLRAAFLDNWLETGGEVFDPDVDRFPDQPRPGSVTVQVVRGSAEPNVTSIEWLFRTLLQLARRRVRITTAYFTPDEVLVDELTAARRRGVQVQILVPGPHADKRFVQLGGEAVYQELLDADVEIAMFMPSMLHAKVMTVDGAVATVGSANFNSRSTAHDDEVNLVIFDDGVVAELDAHFDDDLTRSEPVDPARWEERGLLQRVGEKAVSVVSDLL